MNDLMRLKTRLLYANLMQIVPTKYRKARSIEIIGQVWKWIGGSPDAEDLRIINTTLNKVIENNNQQYKFNEHLGKRIQTLTSAVNNVIKNNDMVLNEMQSIATMLNIDTMNHVLESIIEAILWAKVSVTTNKLLSEKEINSIKTILEDQGVQVSIPDEALNLVQPKIAISNENLLYILKIPQLEKEEATVLTIYPLSFNDAIIKDAPKTLIKTKNEFYTSSTPEAYVQNQNKIRKYNDNCITNLLQGRESNCTTIKTEATTIKLIADGLILIDHAQQTKIASNCGPDNATITGNVLITFEECQVTIDDQTFSSKTITNKPEPYWGAILNSIINWQHSSQQIRQDSLKNIDELKGINLKQFNSIWNWSLFAGLAASIMLTISLAVFAIVFYRKTIKIVSTTLPTLGKPEDMLPSYPGGVTWPTLHHA